MHRLSVSTHKRIAQKSAKEQEKMAPEHERREHK
jgi:hypothetical protein